MKGDFSRNTFAPEKHFLRVLMQQGRVLLDADWNEQTSILLHYLQTLAADIIGKHGGPAGNCGFAITDLANNDFKIGKGHYYVGGVLCINENILDYSQQAVASSASLANGSSPFLVYLDVWERHITSAEDQEIRELALMGPDTTTRTKVIWQVKIKEIDQVWSQYDYTYDLFMTDLAADIKPGIGRLRARVHPPEDYVVDEPCIIAPESRYRGPENQLYRVEIHKPSVNSGGATFKWSRENGAVVFPIANIAFSGEGTTVTTTVTLEHLGRDKRFGLKVGDWVEIVDDDLILQGTADKLLQISVMDSVTKQVILEGKPDTTVGQDPSKHPLLRRWDSAGELAVQVPAMNEGYLALEDGIEIKFEQLATEYYHTGDYWLIPARTETGNILWPTETIQRGENFYVEPRALTPDGVLHYYAPLAAIEQGSGVLSISQDYRCQFLQLCQITSQLGGYYAKTESMAKAPARSVEEGAKTSETEVGKKTTRQRRTGAGKRGTRA